MGHTLTHTFTHSRFGHLATPTDVTHSPLSDFHFHFVCDFDFLTHFRQLDVPSAYALEIYEDVSTTKAFWVLSCGIEVLTRLGFGWTTLR